MKAILQRVTFAQVKVDGNTVGKIDNGFLILLGVAEGDTEKEFIDNVNDKSRERYLFSKRNEYNLMRYLHFSFLKKIR